MRLASVSPPANSERWIPRTPPITCVTAIASPTARPKPRMIAATTPPRVYGRTTPRTISHRVSPSARAPSSSSFGTLRNSSRAIEALIGITMIARTSAAGSRPVSVLASPRKNGVHPSARCRNGFRWFSRKGPSTKIPHRPISTLGIAASISTSPPMMPRTPRGASSERNSAIAIDSGAAISNASTDV